MSSGDDSAGARQGPVSLNPLPMHAWAMPVCACPVSELLFQLPALQIVAMTRALPRYNSLRDKNRKGCDQNGLEDTEQILSSDSCCADGRRVDGCGLQHWQHRLNIDHHRGGNRTILCGRH